MFVAPRTKPQRESVARGRPVEKRPSAHWPNGGQPGVAPTPQHVELVVPAVPLSVHCRHWLMLAHSFLRVVRLVLLARLVLDAIARERVEVRARWVTAVARAADLVAAVEQHLRRELDVAAAAGVVGRRISSLAASAAPCRARHSVASPTPQSRAS